MSVCIPKHHMPIEPLSNKGDNSLFILPHVLFFQFVKNSHEIHLLGTLEPQYLLFWPVKLKGRQGMAFGEKNNGPCLPAGP